MPNTQEPASSEDNSIDVVYVFRTAKGDFDTELFYSLRSIKKYLKGYRNIYVIGDAPRFPEEVLVSFKHLPAEDPFNTSQHNVRHKLKLAIARPEIASDFVLMNDDFFFLADISANMIPFFRQGTLAQHIEWREEQSESPYVRALVATKAALERQGLPTTDFECHIPLLVDKPVLGEILGDTLFDWSVTYGMVFRSLYCNHYKFRGERIMDLKLDSPMTEKELLRVFSTCRFMSTGPGGLNPAMLEQLAKAYPAA